jgi:hypothetical protein
MVLLSVLILTSMSFPAFVRRCTLLVFVLFVLLEGLIFLAYCVVFLFVDLRFVFTFNNVILVHIFVVINRKYDNIIKNNFTLDLEYIDFSPSSTLIKQYQVCLCNTSHVYILINLFDLCQHFFSHCYIHFFKCWHMLNDKGNVSFCHHLASVVCHPSSVNFSHQVSDAGSDEPLVSYTVISIFLNVGIC